MRAIVAIATLALATGAANAAPIYLACDGKTTAIRQGEKDRVFKEVRSLTVDFSAKAVTLEGQGPTPIDWMDETWVDFAAKDQEGLVSGVLMGSIDRIRGWMYAHIITLTDGVHIFEGACKPAKKSLERARR